MSEFFDWNYDRGCWYEHDFDNQTGETIITTKQDVKPVVDKAAKLRNAGHIDEGIKQGMWHYATIPPVVELELRKKGISLTKQSDRNRLLKEIDQNYPHLKLTRKRHRVTF